MYTSRELFLKLLKNDITAVGTMNKMRKGSPGFMKEKGDRPPGDYVILYEMEETQGKLSLHSWLVKSRATGNT